jgi:hypothetical protein
MEQTKSLEPQTIITPGSYDGLWSAYYVEIIFDNKRKSGKIKLNNGVRGMNIPCKVVVTEDGWVLVD